jgi:hypothetical protein
MTHDPNQNYDLISVIMPCYNVVLSRKLVDPGNSFLAMKKKPEVLATQGSWPNWRYIVAHSQLMREIWQAAGKEEKEIINELLGQDAWRRPLQEWSHIDAAFFCRIFSLAVWYRGASRWKSG